MEENKLSVIDGESLMELELSTTQFCIRSLLPQGLCILGGAPKIGKSWLVLDWCVRIANGEPIWGMETVQGTTLYLCLEDTLQRVQRRLCCITEEGPAQMFFANAAGTLADDLEEQILSFLREHQDTVLIVVDTFQMVRGSSGEPSYGGDYQDIQKLKRIADSQRVTILLVHHLRKQGDRDPINKLSGTTGISGAVDAVFVLDKKERSQNTALLICTGRDEYHSRVSPIVRIGGRSSESHNIATNAVSTATAIDETTSVATRLLQRASTEATTAKRTVATANHGNMFQPIVIAPYFLF